MLESVYEDALVWELEQRKDAMAQGREEPSGEFLASLRPCAFALNESLIEDPASDQFLFLGALIKRGVEIDDAGA